jgi:hypothetical protein
MMLCRGHRSVLHLLTLGGRPQLARLAGAILAALLALLPAAPTHAVSFWSAPVVIYSTPADVGAAGVGAAGVGAAGVGAAAGDPVIVADSAGDVHLIFDVKDRSTGSTVLMYARLRDGHWSNPTDMVVGPTNASMSAPVATIDQKGFIQVIWAGKGGLYYSRAHVSEAGAPAGWSTLRQIVERAPPPGVFGAPAWITTSRDGALHVVYSAVTSIRYLHSNDGGESWSAEIGVADAQPSTAFDHPRIVADEQSNLNVTWTEFPLPEGYPPGGTFSSRSTDGGTNWADASRLTSIHFDLVTMASGPGDVIHRFFNGDVKIHDRLYQVSTDGGQTWTPNRVIPGLAGGGLSGSPAIGVDSAGGFHLADSNTGGINYVSSDGTNWTPPVVLSAGSIGKLSIEQPALTISEGNRLHVVWEDDGQRIWYTTKLADAPTVPAAAIPLAPRPIPVPRTDGGSAGQIVAPRPVLPATAATDLEADAAPGTPLLASALASIMLLGAVLGVRAIRFRP